MQSFCFYEKIIYENTETQICEISRIFTPYWMGSRFLNGSERHTVSIFLQSHFAVSISVSKSKKLESLGLAEKNASLTVLQSHVFTIRRIIKLKKRQNNKKFILGR